MADGKKKKKKAKKQAAGFSAPFDANTMELSHKIWLAGVGAYGKAYDTALEGASVVNKQSAKVFEELVKRGEEIEGDVRGRWAANEHVTKAGASVVKAAETARDFQMQARDQFEARMARMRELLSATPLGEVSERLARQLDKIEGELSGMSKKSKARNEDVKARLSRLTAEIESVASETGTDVAKAAMKAADKTTGAVRAAMTPTVKGKAPKSTAKRDDLTQLTGVGPALEKKLKTAGVTQFAQLAALKKADIAELDAKIGARGRIARDNWVKQAKALMK